jgi:tetratricopeptide (TPR) repeat protein
LVDGLPWSGQTAGDLKFGLKLVERGRLFQHVGAVVDEARFRYGGDLTSLPDLRALEDHCRPLWEKRYSLLALLRLQGDAMLEEQLQSDLVELAILWTDFAVLLAPPGEIQQAHKEALKVLTEAERLFGAGAVLSLEQQKHYQALGLTERARAAERQAMGLPPRTAWDHYALARFHLGSGRGDLAMKELDSSLNLRPDSFWTNYLKGQCAFRLKQFEEARVAFHVCIALRPNTGWCYYNLALAYAGLGNKKDAIASLKRVLDLNPNHKEARDLLANLIAHR